MEAIVNEVSRCPTFSLFETVTGSLRRQMLSIVILTPGGGGTPLYGLDRYVRSQRVMFFSPFDHKLGIDFSHFGHK